MRKKVSVKSKRSTPSAVDPKHIWDHVKKSYTMDVKTEEADRIINSIEYLTKKFARHLVPLNIIYWMVYGGKKLKPTSSPDLIEFGKKVGRTKKRMKAEYQRSFIVKNGMVRGLVDAEEHADYELPRAASRLKSAYLNAQVVKSIVGDPADLDASRLEKTSIDQVSKIAKAIDNVGTHIKALLPPPSKTA
jgi:hypothetical protein